MTGAALKYVCVFCANAAPSPSDADTSASVFVATSNGTPIRPVAYTRTDLSICQACKDYLSKHRQLGLSDAQTRIMKAALGTLPATTVKTAPAKAKRCKKHGVSSCRSAVCR